MAKLSAKRHTGNGAREKALLYFREHITAGEVNTERKVDHLLAWLYTEGYVIVPIDPQPARRGKAKPTPYSGPVLIGTSHCAKLVNGN